jgi:formylglycine-generating enzyme required for sulfatase activity
MFGVQWDLVLKYIEEKEVAKLVASGTAEATARATIQEELKGTTTGSTNWGNYRNSTFPLNRGYYVQCTNYSLSTTWNLYTTDTTNYVEGTEKKAWSSDGYGVLLTTGASDTNKKQNIYDLAGNVWEWTLEKTLYAGSPCAGRGGSYSDSGSVYPASYRSGGTTSNARAYNGFRVALY